MSFFFSANYLAETPEQTPKVCSAFQAAGVRILSESTSVSFQNTWNEHAHVRENKD
jgi:hypothetical protein